MPRSDTLGVHSLDELPGVFTAACIVTIRAISGTKTRIALEPSNPYYSASTFLDERHAVDRVLALRHHNGMFYRYQPTTSYREAEVASIRADLYGYLARAPKAGGTPGEYFKPNAARVSDVVDAMRALTHWPVDKQAPCWLEEGHTEDALDLLACANGILHLPTRRLLPATPHLFALNGISFAYLAGAPAPTAWLAFLHEILPGDIPAQQLLQEWMGYLLTVRTHFQKMLLIVGPKRSGKGTIGRVLRELVGRHHLVAPTLSNLGEQFGRATLIDKPVALIADARLSGRTDLGVLSEVLLSISGEDPQSIPRKNIGDWTGMLPTRFTIMTNEIPRFPDASGALASRFLVLLFRESFYGREDHRLFARLQRELPGILLWALDGLARVTARGAFEQPPSAADAITELENLSSPVLSFVREMCIVRPGLSVSKDVLYQEFTRWSKANGQAHVETKPTFGRNLWSALPFIGDARLGGRGQQEPYYRGLGLASETTEEDTLVV